MALYVEFAFEGAIVANNLIDGGNGGISFANFFEHGGRLGVCSGNIVRNIRGGPTYPDGNLQIGAGIAAEADVAITGNVVEDAVWGLQLGWGPYLRDVTGDRQRHPPHQDRHRRVGRRRRRPGGDCRQSHLRRRAGRDPRHAVGRGRDGRAHRRSRDVDPHGPG